MKWVLYDALFALTFPFLLPGFLLRMFRRGGYAARMGDRFALYPEEVLRKFRPGWMAPGGDNKPAATGGGGDNKPTTTRLDASGHPLPEKSEFVWIHAVSVGEVQVAGQLMREWRKAEPDVRFCFSTTSSTGRKMAEREVTERDVLIYNPLDFPNFVKSALKTVRPRAIVLTESEIWPVFIRKARQYGVPIFLINARVSDRSAPRYALAKCFFGDVFRCFARIFAQSELDRTRLLAAGAPKNRVVVTGSFKFDVARRNPAKEAELREWLDGGVGEDNKPTTTSGDRPKILLGGSTWPGEDEVLLDIYRALLDRSSVADRRPPILVLAPRHFEKADAVEANILRHGFSCIRRSRRPQKPLTSPKTLPPLKPLEPLEPLKPLKPLPPSPPVYLADTTGELMGLYGISDVVFVGKSLCAHGSQNMIEPCLCGKPTLVGPFTENFRPVMSDLLEGGGIVQVPDAAALKTEVLRLFADEEVSAALGARAAAAVVRRQGVVPGCVAAIRGALA